MYGERKYTPAGIPMHIVDADVAIIVHNVRIGVVAGQRRAKGGFYLDNDSARRN